MYIVYKATSPSNKCYIGITKNGLSYRKYGHELNSRNGSKLPFHLAISKYKNLVKWEILYKDLTKQEAIRKEIELIKYYKSLNKSYNICDGGEGTSGYIFTEQAKTNIKIGMSKVDLTNSKDVRLRKSKAKGGKPFRAICIKTNKVIGTWQNLRQCERDLNIPKPHIWRCLKGLRKSTRELTFSYIGESNDIK